MSAEELLVLEERHGAVMFLTLNRPERHHTLSRALGEQLDAAIARAEVDLRTRALVLTGGGTKAFCAGGDMLELSGVEAAAASAGPASDPTRRISKSLLPVIAALTEPHQWSTTDPVTAARRELMHLVKRTDTITKRAA